MKRLVSLTPLALSALLTLVPQAALAQSNVQLGVGALQSNTTGVYNTALGNYALTFNTTGSANTATGFGSLYSNTTAFYNTGTGTYALFGNTTGAANTAHGAFALVTNTTGNFNSAQGYGALYFNTTGSQNTATGYDALFSNTTGRFNTAHGTLALYSNTTGNENTACGQVALYSNTTGDYNTAIGRQALFANTDGDFNTACGSFALTSSTTGSYNTALGRRALENNTTGGANTVCGFQTLASNTTGNFNTAIGDSADVAAGNLTNATAIGYFAIVNASNKVRIGNTNVSVIEGQVAFTASSDRNLKENFLPVDGADVLRKISNFSLTSWNYIGHDPKKFRHYGPMAQDFYAAFGKDAKGEIGTPTTINSGDIAGILMIAVKQLATQDNGQQSEIKALQAENAALKKRLTEFESKDREREARLARIEQIFQVRSPAAVQAASK